MWPPAFNRNLRTKSVHLLSYFIEKFSLWHCCNLLFLLECVNHFSRWNILLWKNTHKEHLLRTICLLRDELSVQCFWSNVQCSELSECSMFLVECSECSVFKVQCFWQNILQNVQQNGRMFSVQCSMFLVECSVCGRMFNVSGRMFCRSPPPTGQD